MCQDQSNHVDCIIITKNKKIHVCCSVQHSDLREVLMVLPTWRGLLTNEQDVSEEQQLMCVRTTAAYQGEDGQSSHGNCDYSTLAQIISIF